MSEEQEAMPTRTSDPLGDCSHAKCHKSVERDPMAAQVNSKAKTKTPKSEVEGKSSSGKKAVAKSSRKRSTSGNKKKLLSAANSVPDEAASLESKEANHSSEERLLSHGTPFVSVQGQWNHVVNASDDPLTPQQQQLRASQDAKQEQSECATSALSATYASRQIDPTWVCVFCHIGSHQEGLGDLFGPYFVNVRSEDLLMENQSNDAPSTSELASKFILSPQKKRGKKRSRSSTSTPEKKAMSEVWFHEDCVCWMPQVYLVGSSQVLGLEEAILATRQVRCALCGRIGGTLACIHSGCRRAAHFPCAKKELWVLEEDEFSARCNIHSRASDVRGSKSVNSPQPAIASEPRHTH